jgi:hypothetical protein
MNPRSPLCRWIALAVVLALTTALRAEETGILRTLSSNTNAPASTISTVPFDTTAFNTGGFPTSATTIATAQDTGLHTVAGHVTVFSSVVQSVDEYVTVNGTPVDRYRYQIAAGNFISLPYHTLAGLNPGDVVGVQILPFGGAVTLFGGSNYTHGSLAESRTATAIQRSLSADAGGAAATVTTVPFDTTVLNTGGFSSPVGAIGTAQSSGLHTVAGAVTLFSGANQSVDEYVTVNGNVVDRYRYTVPSGSFTANFNTLAVLNPGDVVGVQVRPLSIGASVGITASYTHGSLADQSRTSAGVQRTLSTDTPAPGGVATDVPFSATVLNTGAFATPPGTLATAQDAGLHDIAGALTLSSATAQFVDEYVTVNGTPIDRYRFSLAAGALTSMPFDTLAVLNPGDVVGLQVFPFGGAVTIAGGPDESHGYLTYTAVPEPSSLVLVLCGMAGPVVWRRNWFGMRCVMRLPRGVLAAPVSAPGRSLA